MTGQPPPDVAVAAAKVEQWLRGQEQQRVSEEQFSKMSPAQRLDYCRRFPQILPSGKR